MWGDVVDYKEGVSIEVWRCLYVVVFFLVSCVSEGEVVGCVIDVMGDVVGVFDGWVIFGCLLGVDKVEGDGGFIIVVVVVDGDGYGDWWLIWLGGYFVDVCFLLLEVWKCCVFGLKGEFYVFVCSWVLCF